MNKRYQASIINHKNGNFQNNCVANLERIFINTSVVSDGGNFTDKKRNTKEIQEYLREASDKAWLSHSRLCENEEIENQRIENVTRILEQYRDIPDDGYTEWECGYWNGIMSALRWALGDDRDFLDT